MPPTKSRETPKFLGKGDADAFEEVYRRIREICTSEGRSPTIDRITGKSVEVQPQDSGMYAVG